VSGRAVVTGGAGFIGSHLCRRMLERGWEVVAIDNLVTGRLSNIEDLFAQPTFTFQHHNVSDYVHVAGDIDAVLHFASPASPRDYLDHPIATLKVGGLGTHNLLGLARAKHARFLLASTSEVYGDPLVHPQPESYWGNVNPVGLRSVYDEAKRFAEAMTMAYHRAHGLDVRIVRIFNTYGPHLRPGDGRAIPNFMAQAIAGDPITIYGDGLQTRSFTYIDDEVEGILRLLESDWIGPMNIGNPEEHTILELAHAVIDTIQSGSAIVFEPLPADDPKVRRPDISLAREVLGWEPKVRLREGLARTAVWYIAELAPALGRHVSR
jgi:dTDP-glucose 4,6-dehydratase